MREHQRLVAHRVPSLSWHPREALELAHRLEAGDVRREHGVDTVLYVSMDDLGRARLDASGDLMLDGHRISVLYSRCGRVTARNSARNSTAAQLSDE